MQWIQPSTQPTYTRGYSGQQKSPAALGLTIGAHVLAIAAIIMMPPGTITKVQDGILWTENVALEDDPPPIEPPAPVDEVIPPAQPTQADPIIDLGSQSKGPIFASNDSDIVDIIRLVPPKAVPVIAEPVFIQAQPDKRYLEDFQPHYPGTMIRADMEGFVKVRIYISAKGRVDSIELVETTDTAFWKVTRKQALRHWRFKPATRDGIAVSSERVMVVNFRLDDL